MPFSGQGCCPLYPKFGISPVPEMVRTPLLFNSQYNPFPNGFFSAFTAIGTKRHNNKIKKLAFFIIRMISLILITFPTITSTAQQLCIREYCSAAETPRGFMVNLQFIWSKVLVADIAFIEAIGIGCHF